MWAVVETDNFGGDYPDESFVERAGKSSFDTKEEAELIARDLNAPLRNEAPRYYKVVELPYKLQPGFEP